MPLERLIPILQVAIGPVILISGVGLLLLSMTNRFARVIDRSRALAAARGSGAGRADDRIEAQLAILSRRARLCRLAMTLASLSVLLAAVLVVALFLTALLELGSAALVTTLFIGCLAALVASLVVFLRDIDLSLAALRLELAPAPPERT
jgi:hypothetical protein